MTAAQMLLDSAAKIGFYGLMARSSGPQIRGGEVAAFLRFGSAPVSCLDDRYDVLVALDWLNVERFAAEMPLDAQSLIICDSGAGDPPAHITACGARIVALPLQDTVKSVSGGRMNMVGLGLVAALLRLPEAPIVEVITHDLGKKGEIILKASTEAMRAGAALLTGVDVPELIATPPAPANDRWNISGNEAAGLGSVRGGIRFVAAYPITPATEILEWLAPNLEKIGGVLVQAEDELASINMIIGASFGGVPALTATSGPGLSLMSESLGLAVASETPVVVVDVMRSGPSTGIATKSEQSDLNIAVHGLHGDAPHVVVAPLDIGDCVGTAQWAVHLAEAMQTPVIMLSDQALGQTRAVIDRPAEAGFAARRATWANDGAPYARYALTESGVSAMALPGVAGGQYTADGLTHNVKGTPSSQARDHIDQLDKRRRKIENFDYGAYWAEIDGEGDTVILTWGSVSLPVREAVKAARAEGHRIKIVALRLISPPQPARLAAELAGARRVLIFEQNHSGQFWRYLRAHCDLPAHATPIHRSGPLPFRPGEIREHLTKEA